MFAYRIDESLELRLLEDRQADELFALVDANRAHLRQWLPWVDETKSADDTRNFIRRTLEALARNDGFTTGIWHDGRIVGVVGLHYIKWTSRKTEIGYWLAESAQGKGIMTRTCRALTAYLVEELKLNRVEIRCNSGNHRSRAVPRRIGFTEEAILRQAQLLHGEYQDDVVYAMLAQDWKKLAR
jgi:ribosomal-protein-serine acetyltransferase